MVLIVLLLCGHIAWILTNKRKRKRKKRLKFIKNISDLTSGPFSKVRFQFADCVKGLNTFYSTKNLYGKFLWTPHNLSSWIHLILNFWPIWTHLTTKASCFVHNVNNIGRTKHVRTLIHGSGLTKSSSHWGSGLLSLFFLAIAWTKQRNKKPLLGENL